MCTHFANFCENWTSFGFASFCETTNLYLFSRYLPELVSYFIQHALDKSDSDREDVSKLITELKSAGVISSEAFMEVST